MLMHRLMVVDIVSSLISVQALVFSRDRSLIMTWGVGELAAGMR